MRTITIRFPEGMVEDLDEEMDQKGISNRSEYIRTLIHNSPHRSQESLSPESSDEQIRQPVSDMNKLEDQIESIILQNLEPIDKRMTQLERKFEELDDRVDELDKSDIQNTTVDDDHSEHEFTDLLQAIDNIDNPVFSDLGIWMQSEGPQKKHAQNIILDATKMLYEEGPLSVGDLKDALYREYDEYDSSDSLWEATVRRFDDEIPGLIKEGHGSYDFKIEAAENEIDSFNRTEFFD